jgi:cob(I)alamin adenosyltransferase
MSKPKSITTGVGDKGNTRLYSGEEVSKDSPRPEACGDVDELVSTLGVASCHVRRDETREVIVVLQRSLFIVAAEIATTPAHVGLMEKRVDAAMVKELDARRQALEKSLPAFDGFVIPGGSPGSAHLDHARSVARRCERHIVALQRKKEIDNPHILVWVNRLSDYLWLLARSEEDQPTMLHG